MSNRSNLKSVVKLLDSLTLNNQGKFVTLGQVTELPHGEVTRLQFSVGGSVHKVLSSNKNWTGALFIVPDDEDMFMVFQLSLPKKGNPPLQLKLYIRRSEGKYISLIAIDVIDGYLEGFGINPGLLTLASLMIEKQPRHYFRFNDDYFLRRFASNLEGVTLVEQRLMEYEEQAPNPDTLPFSPAHSDSQDNLALLTLSQTTFERLAQANIHTLGQLAAISFFDLLKFDLMGRKTANEVKEFFDILLSSSHSKG